MYVILNIKEICAIFPAKRSMMISLINGVFGASAGIFILFKLIYVNTDIELPERDFLLFNSKFQDVKTTSLHLWHRGATNTLPLCYQVLLTELVKINLKKDMFLIYLFLSISIWVKTFFFAPFKFAELNTLGTYNVLADSAIGSCFGFRDTSTGINQRLKLWY